MNFSVVGCWMVFVCFEYSCEGGLEQQRNDGIGCTSMREISERVDRPGTYVTE